MATKKIRILNPSGLANNTDLVRAELGGRWVLSDSGYKYERNLNPSTLAFRESRTELPVTDDDIDLGVISRMTEVYRIDERIQEEQDWLDYVDKLFLNKSHSDYSAQINTYPTNEEALNADLNVTDDLQGVEFRYNFLDRNYERELQKVSQHSALTSIYEILDETTKLGRDLVGDSVVDFDILRGTSAAALRKNARNLSFRPRSLFVAPENNDLVLETNGNKYLFPMYAQVNVATSENNEITKALADTGLAGLLLRDIRESATNGIVTLTTEPYKYSNVVTNAEGESVSANFDVIANSLMALTWWSRDVPAWAFPPPLEADDAVFLGPDTQSSIRATESEIMFPAGVSTFKDKMLALGTQYARNYNDILKGEYAYSEDIMYKIEKYNVASDSITANSPVQTFYMFNFSEVRDFMSQERKLRFVDTQVKYGQQYTYSVTAFVGIVGADYEYSSIRPLQNARPRSATFTVNTTTKLKILEVPIFLASGKILDNPPLSPQIRFAPVLGQTNNLKMLFGANTGTEETKPIALSEEEQSLFDQIAINQGRSDGTIMFKEDDNPVSYEIYRVVEPPSSYDNFIGNLYAIANTTERKDNITLEASTSTLTAVQKPNTKYYYMFRTIDFHGNISNPSEVYEIELYDDGGAGYPIIRPYEFGEVSTKTNTKTARKIIQIVPRFTQAFLNEEASGLIVDGEVQSALGKKDIILGLEDEPLFARDLPGTTKKGKKFKVRLTSKSTGKMVDLNITFQTKRIRSRFE
tara:strand:- start:3250 stop:5511 length:2262 start_codon:yes stop_codon:yes gene_type:complete